MIFSAPTSLLFMNFITNKIVIPFYFRSISVLLQVVQVVDTAYYDTVVLIPDVLNRS